MATNVSNRNRFSRGSQIMSKDYNNSLFIPEKLVPKPGTKAGS